MSRCRLALPALLAGLLACADGAAPETDALDPAPAPADSLVPVPPATATDVAFPNAPAAAAWTTVADHRWRHGIPRRRDPVYEGDDGSRMVDFGDDDPARDWGRQAAVVADPEVPGRPARALELRLPAGLGGGYAASKIGQHVDARGNGPLAWDPALGTGHLYVGAWVRFSPGFVLNGNVAQKFFYLKSDLPQNAALNHMVGIMVNDGAGGNQLWPAYEPQHPFGRHQAPPVARNDLNDGRWHQVEFLQGPNTPGVANGSLVIWVDGREELRVTDAMFFATGQVPSVNRLEIYPIYGGGTRPVPRDQWMRVGPIVVKVR